MIPKGFYRAKAVKGEFGVTATKGTDYVRVGFVVTDGEFKGQQLSWDGYFTDGTTKRTLDSLRYCGCTFPGNDITNLEGLELAEVSIEVEIESFEKEGETKSYARVAWVNSLVRGISPELQMDAGKKASFAQRMMGQVAFAKQSKPGVASAPASGGAPVDAVGKIPF